MTYYRLRLFLLCFFIFLSNYLSSQNGVIKGKIFNALNNDPVPFASIAVVGTAVSTLSDDNGYFLLDKLKSGFYNITVTSVGFEPKTIFEIHVTNAKPAIVDFGMVGLVTSLKEVEVQSSPFIKKDESPVSLRNIGENEIERSPGGNRDISKVLQSLPGVAPTVTFRNDIIIRGGSPNENRFYLDDIETPNINHFATQGASGGPVGMLNVDFIREVLFYSSAFPANKSNSLSSVIDFKLKDGRSDRIGGKFTLGASDVGLTVEGPANKNASFLVSARRSYLQFLFKAIGLPFLPTYNDFQLKYKWKLSPKDEISFIGLGAIDEFTLNTKLQETGDESQRYLLGYLSVQTQWNYTNGIRYVHYRTNSYTTIVLSRNMLNNNSKKFKNNIEVSDNKILDYNSQEIENKLRIENTVMMSSGFKLNYGTSWEYSKYKNSTFNKVTYFNVLDNQEEIKTYDYKSVLEFYKWGVFGQLSKSFYNNRLGVSFGIRSDGNNYNHAMINSAHQLSPRISFTYSLTPKLSINANTGIFYQLPPYTVLGYRDANGNLVNKDNGVTYIKANHAVAGLDYITDKSLRLNAEVFVKYFDHYPFVVRDQISLANLGSDFGVIGNEEVRSTSKGRSYGFEFFAQQRLYKGFYGMMSYTYVRSEFLDLNNHYVPSSWDNRHILNLTLGKSFTRNWECGFKWRFALGSPYTPYDFEATRKITNWNINYHGVVDWSLLNTQRLKPFHNLDIRIDKKYYLKKITLNFYVDVQNLYGFKAELPPDIIVQTDDKNNPIVDPNDPTKYLAKKIDNLTGTVLPTIGIVIEF